MIKISAALATYNEEKNIADCLQSVKGLVDEIVIVDGMSKDCTAEIAKKFGARVIKIPNDPMFHKMKQKAFDLSGGEWILYLDADERVTPELAREIKMVVDLDTQELEKYQDSLSKKELFLRHQRILEERDGPIGSLEGEYIAFFVPRLNCFLGGFLRFGGVYPDGVIRLFKKGKAYLPCKDVHEQMVVNGRVGWLQNDLLHLSDPTFSRYLQRNDRYINLLAQELERDHLEKSLFQSLNYFLIKPFWWFLMTTFLRKGVLDGPRGIIFSLFSALRFPRAYWRYLTR